MHHSKWERGFFFQLNRKPFWCRNTRLSSLYFYTIVLPLGKPGIDINNATDVGEVLIEN